MDVPAESIENLPRLLMIVGCVPDPMGSARRRRAWRLLEAACRDHAVDLAAIADGPVNLRDWRRLDVRAHRHALLPAARPRLLHDSLRQSIAPWRRITAYDIVVCDDACLWSVARAIHAPRHLDATRHAAAMKALLPMRAPAPARRAA